MLAYFFLSLDRVCNAVKMTPAYGNHFMLLSHIPQKMKLQKTCISITPEDLSKTPDDLSEAQNPVDLRKISGTPTQSFRRSVDQIPRNLYTFAISIPLLQASQKSLLVLGRTIPVYHEAGLQTKVGKLFHRMVPFSRCVHVNCNTNHVRLFYQPHKV